MQGIKYIAIGRPQDSIVLSSYSAVNHDPNDKTYNQVFRQVMRHPLLKPSFRFKLDFELGNIFLLIDSHFVVYLVVVDTHFRERHAFELLNKVSADCQPHVRSLQEGAEQSFQKRGLKIMKAAVSKTLYALGNDKMVQVQQKVDEVVDVMQDNIKKTLLNTVLLEDLEEKTAQLSDTASKFSRDARKVKNKNLWNRLKLRMLGGGVATIVLTAIVLPIVL
eukprot:GILJ01002605.1.p1 GENE.GILJ01002605.1~~GILJ01002605.1.p1  ORF type:complete len:220 (+),score=21.95 GILJ01002605.1:65-724(+)